MKVTLEILRWDGGDQPQVLYKLSHNCHSLETVRATIQAVIDSPDLSANGYRILTDAGDEIYGSTQRSFWPAHQTSSARYRGADDLRLRPHKAD